MAANHHHHHHQQQQHPVILLTRPVGDTTGLVVTALFAPIRHFAIYTKKMIWEFDQEGVHYYSCGDFHVEREWACGHSAYTEYFLMGECVREVGELKEYAKGWGEENDYHAVLNNCQKFAQDFSLFATRGKLLESPNFDCISSAVSTKGGAFSHGPRQVVTMGGAKAQYGIVKGEVKAPTLSAVGKTDNCTASGYVNASVCEAKAALGPLNASVGLNVKTGGHVGFEGVGVSVLGFGIAIGPKNFGVSLPFASLKWEH